MVGSYMKHNNKKIKIILLLCFLFVSISLIFVYDGNNRIQTTYLDFKNDNVNNPVRIVQVSDLHNKYFGKNNKILIKKIKNENPDIIVVTGDVISFHIDKSIHKYYENLDYLTRTLEKFQSIAPTYFVLGNHEKALEKFDIDLSKLKKAVKDTNIITLINQLDTIKIGNTMVNILGVDNSYSSYYNDRLIDKLVKNLEKKKGLKIILNHYPIDFSLNGRFSYKNYDVDYVFSGHGHGGIIRIPLIGALLSHGRGLFPKYAEGVHVEDNVTLIISRGLGNSIAIPRIFNRPELIVVRIS